MQKNIFLIDKSLYPASCVRRAIRDFGDDFSITYTDGALTIEGESPEEVHTIFHECMNYILAIRVENR